jgi:hypothetical protein
MGREMPLPIREIRVIRGALSFGLCIHRLAAALAGVWQAGLCVSQAQNRNLR